MSVEKRSCFYCGINKQCYINKIIDTIYSRYGVKINMAWCNKYVDKDNIPEYNVHQLKILCNECNNNSTLQDCLYLMGNIDCKYMKKIKLLCMLTNTDIRDMYVVDCKHFVTRKKETVSDENHTGIV